MNVFGSMNVMNDEFYTDANSPLKPNSIDLRSDGVFDSHAMKRVQKLQTSEEHYVIPNHINGAPITSIEFKAFQKCRAIKTVSIPRTVDHIGIRIATLTLTLTLTLTPNP